MLTETELEDCPFCPNQGWYTEGDRHGEAVQIQCVFCWTNPRSKFWAEQGGEIGMTRDLYVSQDIVWRIFDPEECRFCVSGRGWWATNGRSVWFSKSAAGVAKAHMPSKIRDRLVVKRFVLVEIAGWVEGETE